MAWQGSDWIEDFRYTKNGIFRSVENLIRSYQKLARDLWRFFVYFVHIRFLCAIGETWPFAVAFMPQRPRSWHLIWPIVYLAGGRIIADEKHADLVLRVANYTTDQDDASHLRVVDNARSRAMVENLRVLLVGGDVVAVFAKHERTELRFSNLYSHVYFVRPKSIFTENELSQIASFAYERGLDWARLDILRDARDGRIHIVDTNNADLGAPIELGLREKIEATRHIARALRDYVRIVRSARDQARLQIAI